MKRLVILISALILMLSIVPASETPTAQAKQTGHTYILVHGAFQDASAWDAVTAALEDAGQTAIAVNLPGRGDDTTPYAELTLDTYRDAVIAVIEEQDQPVILVGHSFGGMVISAVAEEIPDQIAQLVYVAAFLPQSGDSLLSISMQDPNAQEDGFVISDDGASISVPAEAFPFVFCPDCTPEQAEQVSASQLDEPLAPLAGTVNLTDEHFGAVAKTYVMTAFDLAVSPTLQMIMLANTPVDHIYALTTGHVPYETAPEALANLLISVGVSE